MLIPSIRVCINPKGTESLQTLYSHIEKHISTLKRPAIVAINGAITSGKTTLARGLERYLRDRGYRTQLVCVDDFHRPREVRMRNGSIQNYYDNAIDLRQCADLLAEMKRGPVNRTLTLLDMNTDKYENLQTYTTDRDTVVIVEGVLLFRQPILPLFDYTVYLDVSGEEIMRRGAVRDAPLYGEQILRQYAEFYIPLQRLYEELCSPKEHSHLVVDNNDVQNPVIVSCRQ